MTSRPMPPRVPVEISPTTAPTTAAAPASRSAGKRYGVDGRQPQLDQRAPPAGGVAAHQLHADRRSATAGRAACPPRPGRTPGTRRSPTTDIQSCHGYGPSDSAPPQPAISGASATSGTVWRQDHVRQQPALDDPEPLHQRRPAAARTSAPTTKPDRGDAEREQARVEHHRATPAGRRSAPGRPSRRSDVEQVRHGSVVGARQHPHAEQRPCRPGCRPPCSPPSSATQPRPRASTAPRRARQLHAVAERERRDDVLAVRGQGGLLGVVLQVDANWSTPSSRSSAQPLEVVLDRAEHAEPVDDLVGHEVGVGVAGPAVLGVVVALAGP